MKIPDAKLPTPNLKFVLAPTPNPDASQWNIAGVGSQCKILALACIFHVFCVDFICVCTQREPNFRWNMGFSVSKVGGEIKIPRQQGDSEKYKCIIPNTVGTLELQNQVPYCMHKKVIVDCFTIQND